MVQDVDDDIVDKCIDLPTAISLLKKTRKVRNHIKLSCLSCEIPKPAPDVLYLVCGAYSCLLLDVQTLSSVRKATAVLLDRLVVLEERMEPVYLDLKEKHR